MKTKKRNDQPDCEERLRRAFSYREKALKEAARAEDEPARFAAQSHAREADRLIPGVRDEISRQAAKAGRRLHETLARQEDLFRRAAIGAVPPRKANKTNRGLENEIAQLRGRLAYLNHCLNATNSEELGGFVDMPLGQYVRAVRKKVPRVPLTPSPAGFVLWIGLVALAVLASLYYLDYFETVQPVAMEVAEADAGSGNIRIMCRNDSEAPILLHVPWHDTATARLSGARGENHYGVAVYVREKNSKKFRLYPVQVSAWTYQGRTIQESVPIEVAPHLYVSLVLDQSAALAGTDPQAVRIVLLDASGRPLVKQQINVRRRLQSTSSLQPPSLQLEPDSA